MADFMVLPRPAKSVQNGAGFSGNVLTFVSGVQQSVLVDFISQNFA